MAKAMRYILGGIERETEKAILAKFLVYCDCFTGDEEWMKVWLPKSQIELYHQFTDGDKATIWKAPLWLVKKNSIPTTTKAFADELISKVGY